MSRQRLTRSDDDRLIAGVCGGLAEFFGVDTTLIRIGFVLFGWFGAGVLIYLILWLIVPSAAAAASYEPRDVVRESVVDMRDTANRAAKTVRNAVTNRDDDNRAS